jgi:hypothetical protein
MKKIYDFFVVILAVYAVKGGAGWLFFERHIPAAIGVILLGAMAFPYVKACFKDLLQ